MEFCVFLRKGTEEMHDLCQVREDLRCEVPHVLPAGPSTLLNRSWLHIQRGPRLLSPFSYLLRTGRSGDRIPGRGRSSGPALGPTQLPIKWVPGLFPRGTVADQAGLSTQRATGPLRQSWLWWNSRVMDLTNCQLCAFLEQRVVF